MTWTAPADRTTGTIITAAMWNAMLGVTGNLAETAAAKFTTAGDLFVATGANAGARLAMGSALQGLRVNAAGTGLEYAAAGGPSCRVYHNTDQTVANGTSTALAFNSERYDNASIHDTATNNSRLTAPVAGVYLITAGLVYVGGTVGEYDLRLRVNGATIIAEDDKHLASTTVSPTNLVSTQYKLAAADYVEAVVLQGTGGTRTVSAIGNWSPEFAMTWLGPG